MIHDLFNLKFKQPYYNKKSAKKIQKCGEKPSQYDCEVKVLTLALSHQSSIVYWDVRKLKRFRIYINIYQ